MSYNELEKVNNLKAVLAKGDAVNGRPPDPDLAGDNGAYDKSYSNWSQYTRNNASR